MLKSTLLFCFFLYANCTLSTGDQTNMCRIASPSEVKAVPLSNQNNCIIILSRKKLAKKERKIRVRGNKIKKDRGKE